MEIGTLMKRAHPSAGEIMPFCSCGNFESIKDPFCGRCGIRIQPDGGEPPITNSTEPYTLQKEADLIVTPYPALDPKYAREEIGGTRFSSDFSCAPQMTAVALSNERSDHSYVLSYWVKEIATVYRTAAMNAARRLPENLDFSLVSIWIADTRGEAFRLGRDLRQFTLSQNAWNIASKEQLENAAREGNVSVDDALKSVAANLIYLFVDNKKIRISEALDYYCTALKRGIRTLATSDELKAAANKCKSCVYEWLREHSIPYYDTPVIQVPLTTLKRVLSEFAGHPDLHISPSIDPEKLKNATEACGVPEEDPVVGLIDCTFWGSAKDAVLFTPRAIYYGNSGVTGFLPYSQFATRTFNHVLQDRAKVSIGERQAIDLTGSQVRREVLIAILERVRSEASARTQADESREGLTSIPGMRDLKKILQEDVVEVLRNADEYRKYKIAIPNGILFYGPPGCGKTFVAQRLAAELGYSFFEVSPGSVGSPYIHETVLKVRSIFEEAAKSSPALIFVDEFEGLVPSRRSLGNEQHYKAEEVNEWLVQIGSCSEKSVLFIAATNEPWRIDDAIRRTGRLDKKIYIGAPDRDAIAEMLNFHLRGRPLTNPNLADEVAYQITGLGYSASDLKALTDEAAKLAMRDRSSINFCHFSKAAAERVHPSIDEETQDMYLNFR